MVDSKQTNSSQTDSKQSADQESGDPAICTPCRGTGQVISNLGDETKQVVCPWCKGTGQRLPKPA